MEKSKKESREKPAKLAKLIREFYGNPPDLPSLTDDAFINLCERYGKLHLISRYKFIGLLPEAYRRRIWEKKGFSSIFEFGAKLAGLSEEQVRRALNLDVSFEKKNLPLLREALARGEVSINKLVQVASIATPENEAELLEKVKILPKSALETMVRDLKFESKSVPGNTKPPELFGTSSGATGATRVTGAMAQLNLSPETLEKLLHLQRCGQNLDQLLDEFLEQREQKIQQEKQAIVEEQENQEYEHEWVRDWRTMNAFLYGGQVADDVEKKLSRYINVRIQRVLHQEFGQKCAIYHCPNPAEEIHHTDRFSLSGRHNPYFLAPLCRGHHIRAHAVDRKVQQKRTEACE